MCAAALLGPAFVKAVLLWIELNLDPGWDDSPSADQMPRKWKITERYAVKS